MDIVCCWKSPKEFCKLADVLIESDVEGRKYSWDSCKDQEDDVVQYALNFYFRSNCVWENGENQKIEKEVEKVEKGRKY